MSYHRTFSIIPMLNDNLISDRFSQMDKLFSRITGEKPISEFPSYNLYKVDKKNLELILSVPGYKKEDLEISVLNNKLTIKGKCSIKSITNDSHIKNWIHKGIDTKDFSISFDLDHRVKIKSANLLHGLLELNFSYEIPKEEQPRKIFIDQKINTEEIEHTKR